MTAWTAEKKAEVCRLYISGKSASEIAALFNRRDPTSVVTRNAIIGLVQRNLTGAEAPVKTPKFANTGLKVPSATEARSRTKAAKIPTFKPMPKLRETVVRKPSAPIPLEALTPSTCRWPIGEPSAPSFGFCGCQVDTLGPYCSDHRKIAYTKPASKEEKEAARAKRAAELEVRKMAFVYG